MRNFSKENPISTPVAPEGGGRGAKKKLEEKRREKTWEDSAIQLGE